MAISGVAFAAVAVIAIGIIILDALTTPAKSKSLPLPAIEDIILPIYLLGSFISTIASKVEVKEGIVWGTEPTYNYWKAEIVNGVVTPMEPLTYSEAKAWAAAENNLLCKDHSSAIAIVKFYPTAIWDAAHKGGTSCGYLNHYHLSSAHKNHIWYYGD